MSLFEKATRRKMRFNTRKGDISTEDLWDLSLIDLNHLAKSLNKDLKQEAEEDFLNDGPVEDTDLRLAFDLTLHVLNTKKSEKLERTRAAEVRAEREKLLSLLSEKQDENLRNLSEDELKAKIAAL